MATRSRLGRDPLQGAAKPAAKQPAKAQRKSPARAKTAPQPDAVEQNAPPTALANALTQLPEPAAPGEPAAPAEPAMADALSTTDPVIPDHARTQAGDAILAKADTLSTTDPVTPEHVRAQADDAILGEAALAQNPSALVAPKTVEVEPVTTRCGCTNTPSDMPVSLPDVGIVQTAVSAPTAPCPPQPAPVALDQGAHPVEVFLRGVLEGLLPEGEAILRVEVDPETFALPVEKLFYFSHALQRIVTPMELVPGPDRRPGELTGQLPVLTVRLRVQSGGRHVLTLSDNGQFFRSRLPELQLGMEALRPLVAFIVKRQGSVRLAQGRLITFEIIG